MARGGSTSSVRNTCQPFEPISAWQWNPTAESLLWEIVPLTFHVEHQDEAIRYAILANERQPRDPEMMLQLALVLVNQGDLPRARRLLGSALRVHPEQDLLHVELQFEQARLSLLDDDAAAAVIAARVVLQALEQPGDFQTTSAELHAQLGEVPLAFGFLAEIFFRQGLADESAQRRCGFASTRETARAATLS